MFERKKTNRTVTRFCLVTSLLWLSLLAVAPAHSATVSFTGYIVEILDNPGTSVYTGAVAGSGYGSGSVFSGSFTYGNSPSDASETYSDPSEADWVFSGGSYGGVITDGVTPTAGVNAEVGVINEWVLDAYDALLFSLVVGSPISAGTIVDAWSVSGLSSGAFYDEMDDLHNGMRFGIGFYLLDGSLYSGMDYQNLPPELSAVDGGFFYIEDGDAAGNTRFFAVGRLTGATAVVPVPAAVWLFGSGLLGLIGVARRREGEGH